MTEIYQIHFEKIEFRRSVSTYEFKTEKISSDPLKFRHFIGLVLHNLCPDRLFCFQSSKYSGSNFAKKKPSNNCDFFPNTAGYHYKKTDF